MATGATIYKADLQIADMDRHYYRDHAITLACHPSETEERLMVRLLAFVLYADEYLTFGRGLSTQDEPDLWRKDLTGAIDLWIEIGHPEERDIRRACGRARQVVVIGYSGRATDLWWSQQQAALERLKNLTVISLSAPTTQALARLARRSMKLQCNVQEGSVYLTDGVDTVAIEPSVRLAAEGHFSSPGR